MVIWFIDNTKSNCIIFHTRIAKDRYSDLDIKSNLIFVNVLEYMRILRLHF